MTMAKNEMFKPRGVMAECPLKYANLGTWALERLEFWNFDLLSRTFDMFFFLHMAAICFRV